MVSSPWEVPDFLHPLVNASAAHGLRLPGGHPRRLVRPGRFPDSRFTLRLVEPHPAAMHIVGRDDADDGRVQSVERATDLLQAVAAAAGARATVTELAAATGLNRPPAWRLLRTLAAKGCVHRDPRSRSLTIGTSVVDLARAAPDDSRTSRAHEVLRTLSLQTRETTALAMLDEGDLRYVDEVNPPDRDHRSWLGTTVDPKHATSG